MNTQNDGDGKTNFGKARGIRQICEEYDRCKGWITRGDVKDIQREEFNIFMGSIFNAIATRNWPLGRKESFAGQFLELIYKNYCDLNSFVSSISVLWKRNRDLFNKRHNDVLSLICPPDQEMSISSENFVDMQNQLRQQEMELQMLRKITQDSTEVS